MGGDGSYAKGLFLALLLFALLGNAGCNSDRGGPGVPPPLPPPPGPSLNKLNVTIEEAFINSERRPVVRFFLTDDAGKPLSASGVRIRLLIAVLEENGYRDYITTVQTSPITGISAVQASFEDSSQGTLNNLGGGFFEYIFSTVLPENYDRSATHTVGIFADATFLGVSYVSNATFDFVPNGRQVSKVRDLVRNETCNTCHNPLEAHGGFRRDVKLCVLCHSTEITDFETGITSPHIDPDTGNNLGFPIMVHKIHRGENLPSVEAGTPYRIIGFRQSVFDFSHVAFPQDIRNCETCHTGGTQSDEFMTNPTRDGCGSCHDNVNFASGAGHGGGAQLDDNNCSACHLPATGKEFDLSVVGSHTIPQWSQQAPGINFEILSVRSLETGSNVVAPGEHPVVTFRITTNNGTVVPPSAMNFLRLVLAGSTREYSIQDYNNDGILTPGDPTSPWTPGAETFKSEDPRQTAVGPDPTGAFTYTFTSAIPLDATGSYAIGIEGYKCATIEGANQRKGGLNCSGGRDPNRNGVEDPGEVFNEIRDVGPNEVFFFPVTDSSPVARRVVVDGANCSTCHGVFSKDFLVHGGIRNNVYYCALCHNPSNTTLSRQLPPIGEVAVTESVDYKVMIHKIHRGENLTSPYVLYSPPAGTFPNQTERATDFSEVLFPGDLRDCESCHATNTYTLEAGRGVLSTWVLPTTTYEFVREESSKTVLDTFLTPPITSVCTSCHDNVNFETGENHLGGPQPESACVSCHGVGNPLSVERTHFPPLPPNERINRPN